MGQEVIFKDGEVSHRGVDHRREGTITIFCHDNIASPGVFFFESSSLDIAKGLIDWKLHSITRDCGIENDIRVRKLAIHAVECFDKLATVTHSYLKVKNPYPSDHLLGISRPLIQDPRQSN